MTLLAGTPWQGADARVSPILMASHLQLALEALRAAEVSLRPTLEGRPPLRPEAAREQLAEVTERLDRAREWTQDPDQRRALDEALVAAEALRGSLGTETYKVDRELQELESRLLRLRRAGRSQHLQTEEAVLKATPRP